MNPRARLSGYFERSTRRREERREEKERESRKVTDARRAAALHATGLLPASRRYSTVLPDDFDALDYDQASSTDTNAIENKAGSDGKPTAAEDVIRSWRERNAAANAKDAAVRSGVAVCGEQVINSATNAERSSTDSTVSSSNAADAGTSSSSNCIEPQLNGETQELLSTPTSPVSPLPHASTRSGSRGRQSTEKEQIALSAWRFPSSSTITPAPKVSKTVTDNDSCTATVVATTKCSAEKDRSSKSIPSTPQPAAGQGMLAVCSKSKLKPHTPPHKGETIIASGQTPTPQDRVLVDKTKTSTLVIQPQDTLPVATRNHHLTVRLPITLAPSSSSSTGGSSVPNTSIHSVPALSPTISTRTTTSMTSATIPRTPSTSSHGHDNVRILEAPMEHEEDTMLAHEEMQKICGDRGEPMQKEKGFGESAFVSSPVEIDTIDDAKPPPQAHLNVTRSVTSVTSVGRSKRKLASLFSKRRNTDQHLVSEVSSPIASYSVSH